MSTEIGVDFGSSVILAINDSKDTISILKNKIEIIMFK